MCSTAVGYPSWININHGSQRHDAPPAIHQINSPQRRSGWTVVPGDCTLRCTSQTLGTTRPVYLRSVMQEVHLEQLAMQAESYLDARRHSSLLAVSEKMIVKSAGGCPSPHRLASSMWRSTVLHNLPRVERLSINSSSGFQRESGPCWASSTSQSVRFHVRQNCSVWTPIRRGTRW